ncbi:hypothetical protein PM082_023344 [Marasmius tenuissimus]|nr:hypothetical protein PM082_023344 [Marasmius tenuissimus]
MGALLSYGCSSEYLLLPNQASSKPEAERASSCVGKSPDEALRRTLVCPIVPFAVCAASTGVFAINGT